MCCLAGFSVQYERIRGIGLDGLPIWPIIL